MPHSTTDGSMSPDGTSSNSYDYIIIGAGIAGSALASRLSQRHPQRSVLLIEAGKDSKDNPLVPQPLVAPMLRGSELDWKYESTPQKHLGGRRVYEAAGKALGGGSVINYGIPCFRYYLETALTFQRGLWTRGDRKDYETWVKKSGDSKWSYDALLPYFRRSESHFDPTLDPKQHGIDGPVPLVSTSSTGRDYPLRPLLQEAWASAGVEKIPNPNAGSPLGVGDAIECRSNKERIIATDAYSMKGVSIQTNTVVSRVVIEQQDDKKVATGIELANGRIINVQREVIVSAGALHTPKVLLLSGIGPKEELAQHGIPQKVESPQVGQNLFNHMNVKQFWKLRHPEVGAAVGSEKWDNPEYKGANPLDFIVCQSVSKEGLEAALAVDEAGVTDDHPLLNGSRCHVETFIQYVAVNKENPALELDGTHIQSVVLTMLPTSRGSVRLKSWNPRDMPLIDSNSYATEADRHNMREGLRKVQQVFLDTPAGQKMIVEETMAKELMPLSSTSTDEEVDRRVQQTAQ